MHVVEQRAQARGGGDLVEQLSSGQERRSAQRQTPHLLPPLQGLVVHRREQQQQQCERRGEERAASGGERGEQDARGRARGRQAPLRLRQRLAIHLRSPLVETLNERMNTQR